MVLLLVPGMYMAATGWRGTAWPWIGLAAMLFLPALGAPSGVRLGRVQRAAAGERGPLSGALRQQLRHPLYQASLRIRLAVLVRIVFLMTVKPGLGASLATIGVAALLGGLWSLPLTIRGGPPERAVSGA